MVLPVTIGSGLLPANNFNWLPPMKGSDGEWYAVTYDAVADGPIDVYNATDPTSSFSVVDAGANNPVPASGEQVVSLACVQDGDYIHVAFLETNGTNFDVYYSRFDMTDDTWEEVDGAGATKDAIATGLDLAGGNPAIDIAINSDRSRIAVHYMGHRTKFMGVNRPRAFVAGATDLDATSMIWTSPSPTVTAVTDNSAVDQEGPRICPGLSGEFHLLYRWGSVQSSDLYSVRLNTTPALATNEDTTLQVRASTDLSKPIAFTRSGTVKIRSVLAEPTSEDTQALEFDAHVGSGTYSLTEITTDNLPINSPPAAAVLACDGSTVWIVFRNNSQSDDLFESDDADSDTWRTPVSTGSESPQPTLTPLGANIYFRDGQPRFAFLYHDGTDTFYDEIALDNFISTQLDHNIMADQNYYHGPFEV